MAEAVAGIELPEGSPAAVEDAAAAMRGCAGGFQGAGATAVRAAAAVSGWTGLASFTFRDRCGDYRDAAATAESVCARAAGVLRRYARVLEEGRERVRKLQRQGEECVERIQREERAAERAAAASHMAYQASFTAGAHAGALRASFQAQADDAWNAHARALGEAGRARDELESLGRKAEDERERVKEAGSRAAGKISALAGGLPKVAFPGAPAAASTGPPTPPAVLLGRGGTPAAGFPTALSQKEREEIAEYARKRREFEGDGPPGIVRLAGDLLGISDAKQAGKDFGDGDILGGLFHTALAWPGGKLIKLGKEGGEEAVERAVKQSPDEAAERARREGFDTDPAFRGTPGEHLPVYRGGKTEGVLNTGTERYRIVEGQVAAMMRREDIRRAELYINQVPCGGPTGCDLMLPRMLPEGSELTMHGPGGVVKVYRGLAD